jgi:uncharacterized membrane protein YhaH (DUF805 family)
MPSGGFTGLKGFRSGLALGRAGEGVIMWKDLPTGLRRMSILSLLFSFNGRFNRAKYWLVFGLGYVYWGATKALEMFFPLSGTVRQILGVGGLCCTVAFLAAVSKRLHDLSLTAWLAPGIIAVPALAGILLNASLWTQILISGIVIGVGILWLGCAKGVIGPNRYGLDPLEGADRTMGATL